jgi:hypothetical protein
MTGNQKDEKEVYDGTDKDRASKWRYFLFFFYLLVFSKLNRKYLHFEALSLSVPS